MGVDLDANNVVESKSFRAWLKLNWKTKQFSVVKTKPKNTSPFILDFEINIKVNIPKLHTHKIQGEIDIPREKLVKMTLEGFK